MRSIGKRCTAGLGLLLLLAFSGAPAQATAIYAATASAVLTIQSISGGDLANLSIEGSAEIADEDSMMSGNATASTDGSASPSGSTVLGVNDSINLMAMANGSADPVGNATSFFLTDSEVEIENLSLDETFQIDFLLEYTLSAQADVDNLASETANALAIVAIETELLGILFEQMLQANPDQGLPNDSLTDTFQFSIIVAPEESEVVNLLADAEGLADAAEGPIVIDVPAPAALPLFLVALAGLAVARRRA